MSRRAWTVAVVAGVMALVAACASIGNLLQPPRISAAENTRAELRLLGPSSQRPLGGAAIRLYARVQNPNAFGLTLAQVTGNLFLEETRAADVSLPLGLPLGAQQDTVIPLDLAIGFADLPGLAEAVTRFITRQNIDYRLDGTFTVDAGAFGQPTFGPSTLLRGALDIRR